MNTKNTNTTTTNEALPILDFIKNSQDTEQVRATIRTMLAVAKMPQETWRGLVATPPGSLIEMVLDIFKKTTDFPLEIPLMSVLHFVSAAMLKGGVKIHFAGRAIKPDLWTVLLAPSGAGKTTTTRALSRTFNVAMMPEAESTAKFFQDLQANNNSIWLADEFVQLLKKIEAGNESGPMAGMRSTLLKLYDGDELARRTKAEEIVIHDPALSILATTPRDTFTRNLSIESMLDGFMQRFSIMKADRDPGRPMCDFPIYRHEERLPSLVPLWAEIQKSIDQNKLLTVTKDGENAFEEAFKVLAATDMVDQSFFRRVLHRAVKYAGVFHVLLARPGTEIGAEEMGWAARVCRLHLQDAQWLFNQYKMGNLSKVVDNAKKHMDKAKGEGRSLTPGQLQAAVRALRGNVEHAKQVMELIEPGSSVPKMPF